MTGFFALTLVSHHNNIIVHYYYYVLSDVIILREDRATPILGGQYEINCSVYNTSTTTFQWKKDGTILPIIREQLLSFSELHLSNAGRYTCFATIDATTYNSSIDLTLQSKAVHE